MNVSVNSASGVIARKLSNELKDLAAVRNRTSRMRSTGVMKSAWVCRSAGTAMQSIYVAARTIATQNRRCENQSSCPSSLLRTRDTGQQGFGEDQVGTGGVRHCFDNNRKLTTMS